MHNMMHLAPTRRPVTPRMCTTTIAHRDRTPLRQRRTPLLPTDIKWFAVAAQHDRGDLGIATQPAYFAGPDPPTQLQVRPAHRRLQRRQTHRDRHMRPLTATLRQGTFVQGVRADFAECISLALAEGLVLISGRFQECFDRPGSTSNVGASSRPLIRPPTP
jgi:hypothetical protein